MKAVVVKEYAGPEALAVEEVAAPKLPKDGVRVAVHRAALNFYDVLMVHGAYQAKPELPFVLGTEAAGEVVEVGPNARTLKVGDRVMVGAPTGCFAEELAVPEMLAFKLPDSVDYDTAAALRAVYGTSFHALRDRAQLMPGETLLVHGAAGGVGLAAVELGKVMGAVVIGTASTDEKLELVKAHGADHVINYTDPGGFKDAVKEFTGGKGADVIYDPVGGDVFDQSLRCIAWGGRLLVIGFASGRIPEAPANLMLLKSCSVVGVFYGSWAARDPEGNRAMIQELVQMAADGRIHPHVSAHLPLDGVRDGMAALTGRTATGKILLDVR